MRLMGRRAVAARLALTAALGLGALVAGSAAAAPAGASPRGFACATIPTQPVAAGATVSVSARLGGFTVTYGATRTSPTTVPVPSYGLPYPGTLSVIGPSTHDTLARPAGFAGASVVQLCAVRDGPGSPAVLVGAYTGGAHCCFITTLDAPAASGAYAVAFSATLRSFHPALAYDLNQGLVPKRVGGKTLLESADGDFAYQFGCYACTPTPVHLLALSGARVTDVSSAHPAFVGANASLLWTAVRQNETPASGYSGLFGALAAWTAEECEVGHGLAAWTQVESLAQRGLLSDARYHSAAFVTSGSYVPTLKSFLSAHGYCRGQIPAG
jgi:hypothetical protein